MKQTKTKKEVKEEVKIERPYIASMDNTKGIGTLVLTKNTLLTKISRDYLKQIIKVMDTLDINDDGFTFAF